MHLNFFVFDFDVLAKVRIFLPKLIDLSFKLFDGLAFVLNFYEVWAILFYVWNWSAIWKSFQRYFFELRYLFVKLLNFFILRLDKFLKSFYLILSPILVYFKVKIRFLNKAFKKMFWFLKMIHSLLIGTLNKMGSLVILSKIMIILPLIWLFIFIKYHFPFILLAPFCTTRWWNFFRPIWTICADKRIPVSPLKLICLNVIMILWYWSI